MHGKARLLTALLAVTALAGCTGASPPSDVAAQSYPALYLAESLVGEDLVVVALGSAALHEYEPSARDLGLLRSTGLLVLWSEALESWAHRATRSLGDNAPPQIQLIAMPAGEALLQPQSGHDRGSHGDHGATDPHTWLDPVAMQTSLRALEARLTEQHPIHAEAMHARADALANALFQLHNAFQEALAECRHDVVITNHEAHAYLAKRYGFRLLTLHGFEPGSEPSPATVQQVIETIRDSGIDRIFIEEGTDPDALRAIQDETGVAVAVLHALESRPAAGDYLDAQYQNVQELRQALDCT